MAEPKTKPTQASVAAYIASRAAGQQAQDCEALQALLVRITGHRPRMWGPSIVGFDRGIPAAPWSAGWRLKIAGRRIAALPPA